MSDSNDRPATGSPEPLRKGRRPANAGKRSPAAGLGPDTAAESSTPEAAAAESSPGPRFHFFIIDSGWKSVSAQVIRDNFQMIREFQNDDPLYVLSREQSIAFIRNNPDLIGKDPIFLVHDLLAQGGKGESGYHGFQLCLGLLKKPDQALMGLQQFLRFVAEHRHSPDIEKDIQQRLHRKGFEGAIQVIREGAKDAIGG